MESEYWASMLEVLRHVKSPMRPNDSEVRVVRNLVQERIAARFNTRRIRILLLGITQKIIEVWWPENVEFTVVEKSEAMIREFWPGSVADRRRLVRTDWMHLDPAPDGYHFVLGDGVFNLQEYAGGYRDLAAQARRFVVTDGLLIVRVFTQPDVQEDPKDIVRRYRDGEIRDFQELRFRIVNALQGSVYEGIFSNPLLIDQQMEALGLPLTELYAGMTNTPPRLQAPPAGMVPPALFVTYPTVDEFVDAISGHFRVTAVHYGEHALAGRCPIFSLEPLG